MLLVSIRLKWFKCTTTDLAIRANDVAPSSWNHRASLISIKNCQKESDQNIKTKPFRKYWVSIRFKWFKCTTTDIAIRANDVAPSSWNHRASLILIKHSHKESVQSTEIKPFLQITTLLQAFNYI